MKNQINNNDSSFIGNMSYFHYDNKIRLDVKDLKILFELSINPRFSLSSIAKRIGLPRETVAYRIEQLKKRKIITGSIAVINPLALGFSNLEIYIKLKNFTQEIKKNLIDYFINNNNVRWVVEVGGKWDIGIIILSKDSNELYSLLNEIKLKLGEHFDNFEYFNYFEERFTYYGFFLYEKNDLSIIKRLNSPIKADYSSFQKEFLSSNKSSSFILDDFDKKLIKEIETDAMIPIASLSRKLKVSHNTVFNHFRELVKNNVIISIFPMLSISLLGLEWHQVFLNFKFTSPSHEKSFINFCIAHPYIVYYLKYIDKFNYKISIFAKNTHHLNEILLDIRNSFSEVLISYESFIIFQQHKFSYVSSIK